MRAAVLHAERDLRIDEKPRPEPGPGEVLVRVARGGICGSDLHYYRHGGFGSVRLREPMVLGHEIAGTVEALGAEVSGLEIGALVAVNPSTPCEVCEVCRSGFSVHCTNMRFLGSAMRMPHVQGGFAEFLTCRAQNAVPLPQEVGPERAAFCEPLAVCLHAVGQAPVYGARVLITGAGPIGVLLVLAARFAGAREIVVTDILDVPLRFALAAGADRTINVREAPEALAEYEQVKGYFDVGFEASGQGSALVSALGVMRPRSTFVVVGQGAVAELPVTAIVTREIALKGSFRFAGEFALAAELIGSGRLDVSDLLTSVVPLNEAQSGFELAGDKSRSLKVQLALS